MTAKSNNTCYLINLTLPPNCRCEYLKPHTYHICCSNYVTARGVWERRHTNLYPLLKKGDVLRVTGEEFDASSNPKV